VTDVQFGLRSGSGDQGLIATMEAILSVPAIPDPAGFDCGEYSGYLEAAAGVIAPQYSGFIGSLAAGCDALAAITGTAAE
jgi:hypothetical protein